MRKTRAERIAQPPFDVSVELAAGAGAECIVTSNTAKVVDSILRGGQHVSERRQWDGVSSSVKPQFHCGQTGLPF